MEACNLQMLALLGYNKSSFCFTLSNVAVKNLFFFVLHCILSGQELGYGISVLLCFALCTEYSVCNEKQRALSSDRLLFTTVHKAK